jgi:miniconductance mechanosensitive channel
MLSSLQVWLLDYGFTAPQAAASTIAIGLAGVLLLAVLANAIAKRIFVRGLERLTERTSSTWDDLFARRQVFHRLSHLAPAIVIYHFAPDVLAGYPDWIAAIEQGCRIYAVMAGVWALDSTINAVGDVLPQAAAFTRELPLKSFLQVIKLILYAVAFITVVSLLIGESPFLLLSGLGAMTAVLLLIFRDAILGLVAGVQLSANRMVAPGDWIEMPKYGADGDVIEVALTTVKVRNWDKTITTIPTYALISESFRNWRGMTESGGRRIKRAINIDMNSIRFCDEAMLRRYRRIQHVSEYLAAKQAEVSEWNAARGIDLTSLANGRRLTNVGTFRAYVVAYLRHHPMIHQEMTFLVRQLAPTPQGLPLEVYVFSRDQVWANYEGIQADIFDHILAVMPEFDLRVFQQPSGAEIGHAIGALPERGRAPASASETADAR